MVRNDGEHGHRDFPRVYEKIILSRTKNPVEMEPWTVNEDDTEEGHTR